MDERRSGRKALDRRREEDLGRGTPRGGGRNRAGVVVPTQTIITRQGKPTARTSARISPGSGQMARAQQSRQSGVHANATKHSINEVKPNVLSDRRARKIGEQTKRRL